VIDGDGIALRRVSLVVHERRRTVDLVLDDPVLAASPPTDGDVARAYNP